MGKKRNACCVLKNSKKTEVKNEKTNSKHRVNGWRLSSQITRTFLLNPGRKICRRGLHTLKMDRLHYWKQQAKCNFRERGGIMLDREIHSQKSAAGGPNTAGLAVCSNQPWTRYPFVPINLFWFFSPLHSYQTCIWMKHMKKLHRQQQYTP